jgi:methylmalonyl-CoA/ethylmalonyl-CoA epimerase
MGDTRLDHVALAVWRWGDARATLVDKLGGRWLGGVRMAAYNPCQLGFANGMRVELLEPGADGNSFLARFLARSGAGPHHVTFKVDDIRVAIRRARDAGLQVVGERLGDLAWQEAFLHPRSTGVGFVIQLAQSEIAPGAVMTTAPGAVSAAEAGLTADPVAENTADPAAIPFFAAAVPDLDDATALLTQVLHGQAGEAGSDHGVRFRVVSWQADTARIVLTESEPTEGMPSAGTDGPRAETPPTGIQALAVTAGADPGLPAEHHIDGWDVTPVLPELGVRLLTKIRLRLVHLDPAARHVHPRPADRDLRRGPKRAPGRVLLGDARPEPLGVAAGRVAEQAPVLAAELGRAGVADQRAHPGDIAGSRDEQRTRLLQADPLLELQRAHRGDGAKALMER